MSFNSSPAWNIKVTFPLEAFTQYDLRTYNNLGLFKLVEEKSIFTFKILNICFYRNILLSLETFLCNILYYSELTTTAKFDCCRQYFSLNVVKVKQTTPVFTYIKGFQKSFHIASFIDSYEEAYEFPPRFACKSYFRMIVLYNERNSWVSMD